MHAAAKVLIGVVLVVASAWWILQGSKMYIGRSAVADLITVVNGIIPVLVFLLGIFIVWLEMDEMKVEKEIRKRK
jgi:alkylation response protein AidB-like acyl-CoA dehydrogenase